MCSTDRTRPFICEPFTDGEGYSYATCGRTMVRAVGLVPGAQIIVPAEWTKIVSAARDIAAEPAALPVESFRAFPPLPDRPQPQIVQCDCCEGRGCDECDMTGKWDSAKPSYVLVFGFVYDLGFLWRVRDCAAGRALGAVLGGVADRDPAYRILLLRTIDTGPELLFVVMPVMVENNHPHVVGTLLIA